MDYKSNLLRSCAALTILTMSGAARADSDSLSCPVTHKQLKTALVSADTADTTGFNNHFWAVVVNRGGVVCAVAFSGADRGSQWLASRQIAAAKAFTANGLSLNIGTAFGNGTGALSTAQLYQFVQPDNANVTNPLFGLEGGNVLNSTLAYQGDFGSFGTDDDPLIGRRIGGTITFGGGLGLYKGTTIVGGIGVSGDTACADHSVAWRTRIILGLQQPSPADKLTFATDAAMPNGHPHCPNDTATQGSITPP
ncbi:MAG TPA: heme-binding protein [Methylocella sp.]|jgi:uncharacterized protein GlcG (DUF336 family)|nr:heme-binding protein [Methylocella sp.]